MRKGEFLLIFLGTNCTFEGRFLNLLIFLKKVEREVKRGWRVWLWFMRRGCRMSGSGFPGGKSGAGGLSRRQWRGWEWRACCSPAPAYSGIGKPPSNCLFSALHHSFCKICTVDLCLVSIKYTNVSGGIPCTLLFLENKNLSVKSKLFQKIFLLFHNWECILKIHRFKWDLDYVILKGISQTSVSSP